MPVRRLNHAVLFVRDVAAQRRLLRRHARLRARSRGWPGCTGAAFLRAPSSTNDHDLGLFEIGSAAGASRRRPLHRRPLPPRLGGRDARRPGRDRRPADRARRPGRRHRPRDHQGALRQGPRRARVRGHAGWCPPTGSRRRSSAPATGSPRWTCRPRSTGSAPTPCGGIGISVPAPA